MTTTEQMLAGLGIFGEADAGAEASAPDDSAAVASAPSESAESPESETISISEALAQEQAGETVPQDAASEPDEQESEAEETEASELERIKRENEQLRQEKEALLAAEAEEQFEEDWAEVVYDGKAFYQNLINQVKERAYANGRTRAEVDAVIKHMIYDGHDIERLGAPAGTPGMLAWQEETLLTYATQKAERGSTKAQPSEIERLTQTYHLTDADQATLRKFANYPPEAREEIAKNLGAKNTQTTTKKAAAEEVAATTVAARLSNQTPPGVPGPAQKKKDYEYTHANGVKRQETELFARRMGLVR